MLAELLVATSLLTATLKFDGDITVQLQGDGPMNLAVINGNNNQQMRGVARVQGEIARGTGMLGNEKFVSKSPEALVAQEREKLAKNQALLASIQARIEEMQTL